jgi:transposase
MDFHILRQQGLSIRKIAALRGVSRNRVRRALRSPAPPTGSRHRAKGAKLEPFRPLIESWLRDEVTSQWTAERIFDELIARGYDGGRTVVKDHVQVHRPRPTPIAEARFFVKPGQQMQVDWGEMGVVSVGGEQRKLYAFVAVMSWSRALFVRFTTNMRMLTWLDCHRQAFEFFGGVPSEVLIDNLKTGVISRAGGTVRFHPQYEQLAVGYGFRPIACFPQRPKTKGRVERMVRFVRERFFVGRKIGDLGTLNAQALAWLYERANARTHRGTRQRPCDRFTIEQAALGPLREYDVVLEEPRVADAYALVSVDGVRYSVPSDYARRPLILQRRPDGLSFLVDGNVISHHGYAAPGQRLVQDPAHLPPPPKPRHERFAQLGDAVIARLGEIGRTYVSLVEAKAPHAPLAVLREVLEREMEFGVAVVTAALQTLLDFAIVKRGLLSTLCYRFGSPRIIVPTVGSLPHVEVESRQLSVYDEAAA